jgi:hypothetical protein
VKTDADLRWWLVYAHYYNVDKEMSDQLDSIRDSYHEGVPLSAADIKGSNELDGDDVPISFFTRSMDRLCLLGPSYWVSSSKQFVTTQDFAYKVVPENQQVNGPIGTVCEFQPSQGMQDDLANNNTDSREKPYAESVSPHVLFAPLVSQITSLITTERLTEEFAKHLHQFHTYALREQRKKGQHVVTDNQPGMASLPSVDKSKKSSRVTTPWSPNAKGKKKKRRLTKKTNK